VIFFKSFMGLFDTNYSFDKPIKFLRCMDSPSNLKAATSFDGLEVLLANNRFLFLKLMRLSVKFKNNCNEKNELLARLLLFSKAGNSVKKIMLLI